MGLIGGLLSEAGGGRAVPSQGQLTYSEQGPQAIIATIQRNAPTNAMIESVSTITVVLRGMIITLLLPDYA